MSAEPSGQGHPHPDVLQNEDPAILTTFVWAGLKFFQSYGWLLLIVLAAYLYFKDRIQQKLRGVRQSYNNMRENASYDPDAAHRRQLAMDEARRRLQEKHDQNAARHAEKQKESPSINMNKDAARYAEKQKEKEEEKRKEKLEDWDRHLEGKGYRSKIKTPDAGASGSSQQPRPAAKKPTTYRGTDFNPLMGGSGSGGFRPARRSGRGG